MQAFDYLIVGAGSAGCVVANRLSENPNNSVAIFEAGGSSDIWKVKMPLALLYTMHDPKYNWKYYSEPEPYLNNRRVFCPRGKMIGGCSSHNGMVFVRGNRDDYTRWENFGLDDWSYDKVLPYFKKIETWSEGENQYRGSLGPLPINLSKNSNPLFKAFIDAAAEAGHKTNIDMNGEEQEGFGMFDTTMHQGERAGVAKYYLNPVKNRKNLNILKNSFVEKILFEGKKAVGLQVKINNKVEKIYANKEVILSGGSINSPQLLMLSGIGDETHLRDKGIEVIHHSKGVGKNLQDHLETYIQQKCKTPNTLYTYTKLIPKILAEFKVILQNTIDSLSEKRTEMLNYDFAYSLLKDDGVKTKIIKKYLPFINQQVNRYLQMMDFYINFNLDGEFNETVKSPIHEDFSYSSFSEGEKMRIDLALLFTWREVARVKNSVNTNLLIMDEVFDSSLDTFGTDDFLKIIRFIIKDANTFVISHKIDMQDKFENVLKFDKVKGFSQIVT